MSNHSQAKPSRASELHPRNLHRAPYDWNALCNTEPTLTPYVHKTAHGAESIDFANPEAVIALNSALLAHHYHIKDWSIPPNALCPPVPGRVDYIHYVADLLADSAHHATKSEPVKMLDIGIGANGIYSLLASQIYGWHCVGSDIHLPSLNNVKTILATNPTLNARIELRHQPDKHSVFSGIIEEHERFDISVCNPPFHASEEEALKSNQRKVRNLTASAQATKKHSTSNSFNFGGTADELWCNGGERLFLKKMIKDSVLHAHQVGWFTSLVSKSDNADLLMKWIKKQGATSIKEIKMHQGHKKTRIVAWSFTHASG